MITEKPVTIKLTRAVVTDFFQKDPRAAQYVTLNSEQGNLKVAAPADGTVDFTPYRFADRAEYELDVTFRMFGNNTSLQVVDIRNGAGKAK